MELRPYQIEAATAIKAEWDKGNRKTLLVLPTGTGKTIVFCKISEDHVREGERVLILAHRGELLEQAADKMMQATGLRCALEKAESTSIGEFYRIVVGSVQTLYRPNRLKLFKADHFDTIIVDEAHHALASTYQTVLEHFSQARVLGVTATPDRGDLRNLGEYFDSLAYEYSLPQAIKEGYLVPIRAQTIPIQIDMVGVNPTSKDYQLADIGNALDPYLEQIAGEVAKRCQERKTVIFTPLIATSIKLKEYLEKAGIEAIEVNGESEDRETKIERFDKSGPGIVLLNSMLLTEGWDCPSVDCISVLRATKVRGLYCLDTKTEVLTKTGWKTNVKTSELIASFDIETGEIKYTPAIATIKRPLEPDEFFCSISSPSIDIRVTNKHRMIYDHKRKTGWKIATAEHLANLTSGSYIPVSGHTSFDGIPLSDAELKFIGWVMCDGSINHSNGQITITQGEHQPWIKEIQKCIDECGFKYNRFIRKRDSQYNSNSDSVVWTISKGKPRGRDRHLSGWGRLEPYLSKDLHENLFNMTEQQFDVMLHAIHLADGSKQKGQNWTRRSYHINTGNKVFAERLQIMAVLRGYKANVSEMFYNQNPLYIVHLKKQSMANIGSAYDNRPTWIKEEYTPEECWCVETELGTLVTRRNGKIAIVGNCQMIGRGTRPSPETGKKDLVILDFLWHTSRHELCRPACLIAEDSDVEQRMTAKTEAASNPGESVDLMEVEIEAESETIKAREEALAETLRKLRNRKARLVDPLQYEMSIQDASLASYKPSFGWEAAPPSDEQKEQLFKLDISPDAIDSAGKAARIIKSIEVRREAGLSTPKQIRFLEKRGFQHVGGWTVEQAKNVVNRIAASGWRTPRSINPKTYQPPKNTQKGAE